MYQKLAMVPVRENNSTANFLDIPCYGQLILIQLDCPVQVNKRHDIKLNAPG